MHTLKNLILPFKKYKVAAILNIIGLSVAFASFTIITTQVKYDFSFDRHYKNKDRIFRLETRSFDGNAHNAVVSRPMAKPLGSIPEVERQGLFTGGPELAVYDKNAGKNAQQGPFRIYSAEPGALDVLEFEYVRGNAQRFREPNTVLISETVATALYGTEDPVGRSLILALDTEAPQEIIGVYKDFPKNGSVETGSIVRFIGDADINANNESYVYYIRLNAPQNRGKVEAELWNVNKHSDIFKQIKEDSTVFRLSPISEIHYLKNVRFDPTPKSSRTTVWSLLAIAVLIIGIAIVNFVNFSIALTPVRLRSINTQKVFGNTNGAIRCNLIGEVMGIALLSLLLSLIVVKLFAGSAYASFIESCTKIGSDLQILAITAVVAIVTGLLSGIYPAFYATSRPPILAIKGSFALSPKGKRVRTLLIAFQFVISIVLIVFSISIHVQNRYMQRFNMGFERDNILIQQWIGSRIASQKDAFADKLKSNPAIVDVTFSSGKIVDLNKSRWGQTYKGELIAPNIFPVAPNFLSFMGIGITEGRDFIADDNRKSNFTVIFNQTAQRQYGLTVGERFGEWDIAGIARDFNFKPLQYGIEPIAFAVFGDHPIAKSWQTGTLYVKVNPANLSATLKFIRETIQEFDPDAEENLVFLDDSIGQLYQKERNLSTLILLFSLLSMLISVVGIFGLVLFETQYRRKEIGIRKIHGATVGEILRIFNGTYVRIVLACFVVATPVAYYGVKRWLENFAYRTPIHSWIFLAALIVVLSVVVAIITLRCYKTETDNPIKTIKTE